MRKVFVFMLVALSFLQGRAEENAFFPGEIWPDTQGQHINAHGGGMLYAEGKYYWFGEYKDDFLNVAMEGVSCYSSDDLYRWKNEGIVLRVVDNNLSHPLSKGCIIERPKVIYNPKTAKYVMYFHHELRGQSYNAARVGIAVSDSITGPYTFLKSYRPQVQSWPQNMSQSDKEMDLTAMNGVESWTKAWLDYVHRGCFVVRDFENGQMSRDMTLFVDDDGIAYHIYASEENLTLQIAELSDDYLSYTGKYIRVMPTGHNEAPTVLKKDGRYYLITSGCTGWEPNAARLLSAPSIWGPWSYIGNPWKGEKADISYDSQSTFIFPVQGKKDAYIFMADRWRPRHPSDGRYIWLPLLFEEGIPTLKWQDQWSLTVFDGVVD